MLNILHILNKLRILNILHLLYQLHTLNILLSCLMWFATINTVNAVALSLTYKLVHASQMLFNAPHQINCVMLCLLLNGMV